jgi:hypothetical protein
VFPVVRYQVGKITSTTGLLATTKRLSSPNLAISLGPIVRKSLGPPSRRLLCSPTILKGPEGCAIPSRRNSAHTDSLKLEFSDRSNRDSPWIHPHSGPEITSPLQVLPSITFDDFLSAQPSWTQRLLQILDRKFSYPTIPHHLHTSTSPLAVSDGSVQLSQGTFGWVLATTQPPHQLRQCSGLAFCVSMDSYRAEAYGLLSLATLLDLMSKFFHSPSPPITIWCDNL